MVHVKEDPKELKGRIQGFINGLGNVWLDITECLTFYLKIFTSVSLKYSIVNYPGVFTKHALSATVVLLDQKAWKRS